MKFPIEKLVLADLFLPKQGGQNGKAVEAGRGA